jgi:hypothetical protein
MKSLKKTEKQIWDKLENILKSKKAVDDVLYLY